MPPTIKKLGKVASSPFGALTKSSPAKKSNKLILILIVVGGVAAIWYLRNHSSANTVGSSTTNPAVSINGGTAPDQSTIDNLTASVLALQGQVANNSAVPSGGTSTPVTSSPSQTNPGVTTPQTNYPPSSGVAGTPSQTSASYPQTSVSPNTTTRGMSTTGNGPFEGNQVGWTNTGVAAIQTPSVNGGYPTVTYNGVPYTNDVAGYTGYVNWLQKLGPTQYLG